MTEPEETRQDDFQVRYEWVAGSMPPPFHYEYTILIGPGTEGQVVFRPDYSGGDTPVWTESFVLAEAALEGLYQLMVERGIFSADWVEVRDGSVGGSLEWLRCTAGGEEYAIPSRIEDEAGAADVYAAVKACVPEPIWKDLLRRREQYERDYVEAE